MKLQTRQLMGSLLLRPSAGLVAQQGDGERFSTLIENVRVNGVELHYLEKGSGIPVVLIHGGLGDYREWNPQIERISSDYRVVAYSRRYNYPHRYLWARELQALCLPMRRNLAKPGYTGIAEGRSGGDATGDGVGDERPPLLRQ